ncbi:uncharacterized protein LOC117555032 isoform X3 [Gymnodraco acuticeps]|uniref:Uncharacterized protein LOC117555032 isoform X3 n=1 Tax=Gymnodraco acuticeps TaxID=8218 RepID=A0A6P8WDT4_GYMAC|nr:uncharacterized protein LOC117555032 isoform X3 [Gymnodraco acuticeps]
MLVVCCVTKGYHDSCDVHSFDRAPVDSEDYGTEHVMALCGKLLKPAGDSSSVSPGSTQLFFHLADEKTLIYGTTQMHGDDTKLLLKDIAIQKMTSMLAEVLVVVKDLSRDVQLIKNELAEGNMTPAGSQGPGSATTHMFPIQLPIANEDDFNEAESLLKNESVRQKMIARLALVGGANSENLIRRMLATALTWPVGTTGLGRSHSRKRQYKTAYLLLLGSSTAS